MTMRITHAEILQTFDTGVQRLYKKTSGKKTIIKTWPKTGADYDWGLDTSSIIIRDTDSHPV